MIKDDWPNWPHWDAGAPIFRGPFVTMAQVRKRKWWQFWLPKLYEFQQDYAPQEMDLSPGGVNYGILHDDGSLDQIAINGTRRVGPPRIVRLDHKKKEQQR